MTTTAPEDMLIADESALEEDFGESEAEKAERLSRSRHRRLSFGLILTVLGMSLVLFLVYVFAFTDLRQARAQHQLLNVFTTPAGAVPLSGKVPPAGYPAAVLTIPTLHVRQVVLQGSTAAQTARGPAIVTQTARPGTIGNAVIIGRRTTSGAPFKDLMKLKVGDTIILSSGIGKFKYLVMKKGTATAGQLNPASPVNWPLLTLATSSTALGGTGLNYVVAKSDTAPGAWKKPSHKPTAAELGLAGYPAAVLPSILLGLLFLVAVSLTVVAYLRYRKNVWTVYLLSTPIILAIALWWFENLYLLLPSSA